MSFLTELQKKKPGKRPIFRSSMTINGVTYYAREYGHKAFVLWV